MNNAYFDGYLQLFTFRDSQIILLNEQRIHTSDSQDFTLKKLEDTLNGLKDDALSNQPEFQRLKEMCQKPWGTHDIGQILRGQSGTIDASEYLEKESYQICLYRLKTLWNKALYMAAFRYSTFILKHLSSKSKESLENDFHFAGIIAVHSALMIKLKSTVDIPTMVGGYPSIFFDKTDLNIVLFRCQNCLYQFSLLRLLTLKRTA